MAEPLAIAAIGCSWMVAANSSLGIITIRLWECSRPGWRGYVVNWSRNVTCLCCGQVDDDCPVGVTCNVVWDSEKEREREREFLVLKTQEAVQVPVSGQHTIALSHLETWAGHLIVWYVSRTDGWSDTHTHNMFHISFELVHVHRPLTYHSKWSWSWNHEIQPHGRALKATRACSEWASAAIRNATCKIGWEGRHQPVDW